MTSNTPSVQTEEQKMELIHSDPKWHSLEMSLWRLEWSRKWQPVEGAEVTWKAIRFTTAVTTM